VKPRRVYRFGAFQLDAAAKVLLRDGQPVRLARKAVETLLVLVENAGQVVTKEELLAAVWPGRIVDEANLAQNVAVVRKALGAGRGEPGYIETFPGRGYRILGPVVATELSCDGFSDSGERERSRRRPMFVLLAAAGVIAISAIAVWRGGGSRVRTEVPHRIPVARQAGKEYQPVVSPDGAKVAYVWEKPGGGPGGIWVRESLDRPPRRIGGEGGDFSSPAWSPDGRRLAYLRFQGSTGALVLASLDTSAERILCPVFPSRYGLPNRHLDWSPDGEWLAVDDAESLHQALGIFLVSATTGQRRRLTQTENLYIGDVDPRFSPDGRSVSFIRVFHRAHQELFVVGIEGGVPRQLTFDGKQISGQDWDRDGQSLVFGSDRTGEFRLWRIGLTAKGGKQPTPTGIYGDFPIQLSLARREPVLVYSVLQHDLNIWSLDLAAGSTAQRWRQMVASPGQDASPQYSPDGKRICFRSDRSGEEQLWVADVERGNPVQVTRGALWPSVGRWSPTGRAIVFNNARTGEIYLAEEDPGGQWQVRSLGAAGYHPVFSPDGQWIYAGTMSAVVRLPVRGGTAAQVAPVRGISLDVSKDGRYIYFVREATDTVLWRAEVATGRLEKVLEGLLAYCSSCWALTTRGIYFLGARQGSGSRQRLLFHDFATGRDNLILEYPEPLSPIGSGPFSLSPDGRHLLCVRVDPSNSDVFRVDPFP